GCAIALHETHHVAGGAATSPSPVKRSHVACYREGVGRYSISPAMAAVLKSAVSSASEVNFLSLGDVFESAVARLLYIATLVFCGRPVIELVKFVVAPLAIIGADALAALRSAGSVAFDTLELRSCGSLQAEHPIADTCDAASHAEAQTQRMHLWRGEDNSGRDESESRRRAWIEISPVNLRSASVVLHIPNVVTLAFRCVDGALLCEPHEVRRELSSMDQSEPRGVFAENLHALGAPVVPILFMARAKDMLDDDEVSSGVAATERDCIVAEGIGEAVLRIPRNYNNIGAQQRFRGLDCYVACWLHRVRRSMMLFEGARHESTDTLIVASVRDACAFSSGHESTFVFEELQTTKF
ncbi:Hypothetical protein, putative, partial [Bodo saltans]